MEVISWICLSLIGYLVYNWYTKRNLPPGPWSLPIIGYLPWINTKSPYLTLMNLSKKFGPIYGLYLGSVYTVVLSDVNLIKKIFLNDAASGRAPLYLTHGIMKGYGLICAQGDLWKDQRKFVCNSLRQFGAIKSSKNKRQMELVIMENVWDFVNYIKNQGDKITIDPLEPLRHSLGSFMTKIVLGKSWSRDDKIWKWLQSLQEEGTKHIGVAGPLNFLPILRFLPKYQKDVQYILEGKEQTHKLYQTIIDEEIDFLQESDGDNNNFTNVIQAFLIERKKRENSEDLEKFYNDSQFYHLLADIFGAGLDTTLTTLRWYLLYLGTHKEIQSKIREELNENLHNRVEPSLDDLPNLPLVEASIVETQRIRSVVPVGIPHGSVNEIEISGYKIPKGTMLIPLQWAIHMDPKIWSEPETYNPYRFIDENGKFFKPNSFIPFQTGKRMCIGDELARMLLFLFGATIIQNFEISCEYTKEEILEGECGITLTPKPHQLCFSKLK